MNAVELAERSSRGRAVMLCLFAAISVAVLGGGLLLPGAWVRAHRDFLGGFWVGVSGVAVLYLLPWGRWLRPASNVSRLLDDESTREHRRVSCAAGFWAAIATAFSLALVPPSFATGAGGTLSAFDAARLIATAAITVTFLTFATLELRAARD